MEEPYIPLCQPFIGGNEASLVQECFETSWISSAGPAVTKFQAEFASYIGSEGAVPVASGTSALHLALIVAGVGPDQEVITSNITFVAPVNAIRYTGAWPVLIDASPSDWQMDVQKLDDFLHSGCAYESGVLRNKATGRIIKAILPVHILGHSVNIVRIVELARKFDLLVIEDASESLGARFGDQLVGTFGDAGCFSFNGNKLMTTGAGGMLISKNPEWIERAGHLSQQAKVGTAEYDHDEIGYNYRMSNLHAALGLGQLAQLDQFIESKRTSAGVYIDLLSEFLPPNAIMSEAAGTKSSYWLYTALFGDRSREIIQKLSQHNIGARPIWRPMHQLSYLKDAYCHNSDFSDRFFREAISLPSSVGITSDEIHRVVRVLASFF